MSAEQEKKGCKYGDPYCPCQDGDSCHYEGENPMAPPAPLPFVEQGAQTAAPDLAALPGPLPYERMAVSNLKALNASRLRTLPHALVVERHAEALAVIVPMDWYSRVVDVLQKQAGLSRPEGTR